jgi:predicted phage tail protein
MLVKIYSTVNDFIEFETDLKDTREIFNSIKHTYGEDVTDKILYSGHVFVGIVGDRVDGLTATTLFSDINLYEQLHIIPSVEGEDPISASMIMAAAASAAGGGTVAGVGAFAASGAMVLSAGAAGIIAGVANIAIAIGVSMAVSAIMAPDTSFNSDPAKAQKQSKMFNTALTITEQGGSVPLTYGNPFCGGVLISSGITSSNVGAASVV